MSVKWYGDEVKNKIENTMDARLEEGAQAVVKDFRESFRAPKTGVMGPKARRAGPGEPPAIQLVHLSNPSFTGAERKGLMHYGVGTSVPYGKHLELAKEEHKRHAWLMPAVKRQRRRVRQIVRQPIR